jgi:hypothetical protein
MVVAPRQIDDVDIATATGAQITLGGSLTVTGLYGLTLNLTGNTVLGVPTLGSLLSTLSSGTTGQILQSNGTSALPTWINGGPSAWTAAAVSSIDSSLRNNFGVLGLATINPATLFGNPFSIAAQPSTISIGAGLSLTSGVLSSSASSAWSAAAVSEIDTTLQNVSGVLGLSTTPAQTLRGNPTGSAAQPSAITIGTGLSLSGGGILSNTVTSLWSATAVSAIDSTLQNASGTLGLSTIPTKTLHGNPSTASAQPSAITLGTGLALSNGGVLTASGGAVTGVDNVTLVLTSGIASLAPLAATSLLGNSGATSAEPAAIALGNGLAFSAGALAFSGTVPTINIASVTGLQSAGTSILNATARNIGLGPAMLTNVSTGNYNFAAIYQAGLNITTATNSILIGQLAGTNITTATDNVAIGYLALTNNVIGNYHIAIGQQAMRYFVAAASGTGANVAIGYEAMTGSGGTNSYAGNVAVGSQAGFNIQTGAANMFIGTGAGLSQTTGNFNVNIGNSAGINATATSNNTLIGASAGASILTGGSNTIIGYNVGSTTLTTGTNNIYIGVTAAVTAATASETGFLRIGASAVNVIRATGINTATPALFFDWIPTSTSYASDTLAAAGGVAVGQVYRNGSILQCRIS